MSVGGFTGLAWLLPTHNGRTKHFPKCHRPGDEKAKPDGDPTVFHVLIVVDTMGETSKKHMQVTVDWKARHGLCKAGKLQSVS